MSVITISREFGSDGSYIAEKVTQALGYHFADKKTMEDVLIQYGFVEFEKEYDETHGFWARFDARTVEMVKMLNRIIRAVARHGNVVILGRGSFAILSGCADVLTVRIQAPLPIRRARVMAQQKITEPEQAEAIIKEARHESCTVGTALPAWRGVQRCRQGMLCVLSRWRASAVRHVAAIPGRIRGVPACPGATAAQLCKLAARQVDALRAYLNKYERTRR